jgi:ribose transport system ATP-binding protein
VSQSPAQDEYVSSIDVRGLHKYFGATHALRGVDIRLRAGRVHALLGANGCGKSTLAKTLAGYHQPDAGEIVWHGARSVAFVHQDLALVPTLSVTENLTLTRGYQLLGGCIVWRREDARARRLLEEYGVDCDVREPVGSLGPAVQTMVAITRAVASLPKAGGVLVLDEPTARLPVSEADRLLDMVRGLKQRGVAILYISHRLDEVLQIADEVTVLRDGQLVHNSPIEELDRAKLVRLIVGHDIEEAPRLPSRTDAEQAALLRISKLHGVRIRDVSLSIGRGEVVGVAGLVGSGRSELGRVIFGLQKAVSGTVAFNGRDVTNKSAVEAVSLGMAYVPQERRNGVFLRLSVGENAVLADLASVMGRFALSRLRVRAASEEVVRDYRVKASGIDAAVETLSGGNQQKLSLGKWLRRNPVMVILDEPTQGIDVGARTEIFTIIRELASRRDMGVLVFDSDLDILASYCDRVFVMARGRIVHEFDGKEAITAAALSHAVYGH